MTESEAREMLAVIPSDDRHTWVRVGMALRHSFGDAGWPIYREWSMTWPKFNPMDCAAAWRSFRSSGGITDRTLRWIAAQHGYRQSGTLAKPDPEADAAAKRARQRMDDALEAERKRQQEDAALKAKWMVKFAVLRKHPYIDRKGFVGYLGLVDEDENLLIPVRDFRNAGNIIAVQSISPDGKKRFRPRGCSVKHGYMRIGRRSYAGRTWMVEGWATGMSVNQALLRMSRGSFDEVLVCFSDGGLVSMANDNLHNKRSVVVADNDTSGAGERAAKKTGMPYWMPPETGDANDYHQRHGIDAFVDELWRFIQSHEEGIT